MKITNQTFSAYAATITGDPHQHSPAAMDKLITDMEPWIVRVPTPSGRFHARNGCRLIDFETEEEKKFYLDAWQRYVEECQKLQKESADGRFAALVALGKYRQAAEICRTSTTARLLHEAINEEKAAVFACCYRPTIAKIVRLLVSRYGYSRDDISLIWGGDDTLQADKQIPLDQMRGYMRKMMMGEVLPHKIMRQIERQLVMNTEDRELIKDSATLNLRLGNQSRNQRTDEIYKFQHGLSKICLFTFSAGGVGLSLHHTDIDERGKKVNLLPRRTYLTPTWSAQDFVQGLGRAHRTIFSLSDTEQTILFYRGTIEEDVMLKVSLKLRCLSKCVKARESWSDAIYDGAKARDLRERREAVLGSDINETITTDAVNADEDIGDSEDEEDND